MPNFTLQEIKTLQRLAKPSILATLVTRTADELINKAVAIPRENAVRGYSHLPVEITPYGRKVLDFYGKIKLGLVEAKPGCSNCDSPCD